MGKLERTTEDRIKTYGKWMHDIDGENTRLIKSEKIQICKMVKQPKLKTS